MLSSQNSGKYLSDKWHHERDVAMRDGAVSGEYSQEQLELSDNDVSGRYSKKTYQSETTPLDPFTEPKTRDIRDDPKRGGLD